MHKNLEQTISFSVYAGMGIDNREGFGDFRENYGVIANTKLMHKSTYSGIDNRAFKPLYADVMHCAQKALVIDGLETAAESQAG